VVLEDTLVDLLPSHHAAPGIALYSYVYKLTYYII